eukprot:TRINITY_DN8452_c1_g1_i1.p2 TRINITY_DN8452_c1_g1~~TRINITY_DN8452_c1_g1_i1.p2  ORF type:complete len:131 (-),score=4.19 TRINITY_DN8452_c1_g1_i1:308-700(-)
MRGKSYQRALLHFHVDIQNLTCVKEKVQGCLMVLMGQLSGALDYLVLHFVTLIYKQDCILTALVLGALSAQVLGARPALVLGSFYYVQLFWYQFNDMQQVMFVCTRYQIIKIVCKMMPFFFYFLNFTFFI